jgi:hypothetical protein
MTRDLPKDTDFQDEDGAYGTRFGTLLETDDEYEWPKLLSFYEGSNSAGRETINNVFLYLVGYTLPTLVEQANGTPITP